MFRFFLNQIANQSCFATSDSLIWIVILLRCTLPTPKQSAMLCAILSVSPQKLGCICVKVAVYGRWPQPIKSRTLVFWRSLDSYVEAGQYFIISLRVLAAWAQEIISSNISNRREGKSLVGYKCAVSATTSEIHQQNTNLCARIAFAIVQFNFNVLSQSHSHLTYA